MIKIKNVTKKVKDLIILKNINLEINNGKILGIIGESGAGKSTLLRTINGLSEVSSGEILIDNNPIKTLDNKSLRKARQNIGMVFQNFNLLKQKTVYENIMLSLSICKYNKKDSNKRILELLSLTNLSDKKDAYPKTLSGGEKQRVSIARALASNPKYLLCDEITSALDKKTSIEIMNLLLEINKEYKVTIIFVSHDLFSIKYISDEIVVMKEGEIIEKNSTVDFFLQPKTNFSKKLVNNNVLISSSNLNKETIYRITYKEKTSSHPLIAYVTKNYDVIINILFGEIISLKDESIGQLFVNISGSDKNKAISYLKQKVQVNIYE